ncbi:AAEL000603-PA, partial [Aedes aegypti]
FDSWGKVPSGIYFGNNRAYGNYDQCRQFKWKQFSGEHCLFLINYSDRDRSFVSGLCVPSACTPEDIHQVYGDYVANQSLTMDLPLDRGLRCSHYEGIKFSRSIVLATVFFAVITSLLFMSTIYDVVLLVQGRKADPFYSSFSIYQNLRTILRINQEIPSKIPGTTYAIDCLDGIRSLSMIWIIIFHVHDLIPKVPIINASSRDKYLDHPASMLLLVSGFLAVDTFFVLSGVLVAWNVLKELDKKGSVNLIKFYLQRYVRITAPLAALILFVTSFAVHMGEGPIWKPYMLQMQNSCSRYWWSSILHIQNFVNPSNMCLLWTWYLSVDMQLYIAAPVLIYPLWKYGKRFLLVIVVLALLSMSSVFAIYIAYGFRNSQMAPNEHTLKKSLTYFATHARMAVWLWGLVFGYVLYRTRENGVRLSKQSWIIGWITCIISLLIILSANYGFNHTDYRSFSDIIDATYASLHRSMFSACVMWIIFACVNGKAGVINDILCAPMWQPLAKLSFVMYLLHSLLIMMSSVASVKLEGYFSAMDMLNRIWAAIGITTSVSLFWSACFELPFVTLSKILLKD